MLNTVSWLHNNERGLPHYFRTLEWSGVTELITFNYSFSDKLTPEIYGEEKEST